MMGRDGRSAGWLRRRFVALGSVASFAVFAGFLGRLNYDPWFRRWLIVLAFGTVVNAESSTGDVSLTSQRNINWVVLAENDEGRSHA